MFGFFKKLFSKEPEQKILEGTWLEWLSPDPWRYMQDELEKLIQKQVPGTRIEQIQFLDNPKTLTGAYRENEESLIVKRAGICVKFVALISSPHSERLEGSLSCVAAGLDRDQRQDRIYLDLGPDVETAEDLLLVRIYAVEQEIAKI